MNLSRLRERSDPPALPLTPLVDVLFLMIIFLVLGANFDEVETVRLPEARGTPVEAAAAPLRLELRADDSLWLEGQRLAPEAVLPTLRARAPQRVLLLPDTAARVGPLIRWHDRIRGALQVPVQVGVRPPQAAGR